GGAEEQEHSVGGEPTRSRRMGAGAAASEALDPENRLLADEAPRQGHQGEVEAADPQRDEPENDGLERADDDGGRHADVEGLVRLTDEVGRRERADSD